MEYLLGKFLGNVTFLTTFTAGFMLSSMAMLAIRAEAPMEPLVFIRQYLPLTPAAITFVSALAVLFESIRWLSGKLGDVVYFFLWVTSLGVVAFTRIQPRWDFLGAVRGLHGLRVHDWSNAADSRCDLDLHRFHAGRRLTRADRFSGTEPDLRLADAAHHLDPFAARPPPGRRVLLSPLRSRSDRTRSGQGKT